MRTWVRQEAVFELNERSEFSEKGDLQLACKASTIRYLTNSFFYNLDAKVSEAKFIKTKKLQENKFLKKIYERHPPRSAIKNCKLFGSF